VLDVRRKELYDQGAHSFFKQQSKVVALMEKMVFKIVETKGFFVA